MLAIKTPPLEGVASTHLDVVLRDLAWLAVTPDVVELPPPFPQAGRPSLAELGLDETLDDWLQRLAIPVMAGNGHRASRMGHYHERLWHWLLDRAPNTCLLGHNLRITRKRNTLGELDMLYRRRDDPTPVHLEVAIKFYLGLPDGPGEATDQEDGSARAGWIVWRSNAVICSDISCRSRQRRWRSTPWATG